MVPLTVLYIEDDTDDIELFQDVLKEIDATIRCFTAFNGEAALKLLKKIKPDIIFLDNNMPRIKGIDCLRQIRSNEKLNSIPIVMYSTSDWIKQESLLAGANYFIKKQISFSKTVEIIQELISTVYSKHEKAST